MRVRVVLEQVFQRTLDGAVTTGSSFHADFFSRYMRVFAGVDVVARVEDVTQTSDGWRAVEAPGIVVRPLPSYRGFGGFLRRRGAVIAALGAAVLAGSDALILRVPSPLAGCVYRDLQRAGRPYAVEVVGDPWDVFAPGAIRHPLRPLFRRIFRSQLRKQCAQAIAGCYVTASTLQSRYPLGPSAHMTGTSDVDLGDQAYAPSPRVWSTPPITPRLVMVGTMTQLYKAPDVLIAAVALCAQRSQPVMLDLIGDGIHREELVRLAAQLNVSDKVNFSGHLAAGPAVREHLDQADVFVLPSRTEGLPRALLEAMARGLPCLGSTAGGIPELLEPDEMVAPGSAEALSALLLRRVRDSAWLTAASARNFAKAGRFHRTIVDQKHREFLRQIHDRTATWLPKG